MRIMFKRKISQQIEAWMLAKEGKALLIDGARQVGKTTLIKELALKHYSSIIHIDFASDAKATALFNTTLSPTDFRIALGALYQVPIVPYKTLVFFDEIQKCPMARESIKYLVGDREIDFIESGSLLGVTYNSTVQTFLPVGYERKITMYPLDFEEFLFAVGLMGETLDYLLECFESSLPVSQPVHEKLTEWFRLYLIVGGMPEAVEKFLQTHDIASVRQIQEAIVSLYAVDVAQYCRKGDQAKVRALYETIPSELSNQNKRFNLSAITSTARMERYEYSLNWLIDSGIAIPCYNLSSLSVPLRLNESRSLLKLFYSDIGLLTSSFPPSTTVGLMQNNLKINKGAIWENYVAQQLIANGFHLWYCNNKKLGELDFVVESDQGVIIIESKSGTDSSTHRSLDNYSKLSSEIIERKIVLHRDNLLVSDDIVYLPIYLLMFLKNKRLESMKVDLPSV